MKYLIIFASLFCGAIVYAGTPEVQTTKVYSIHKERRFFVRKPNRPYLLENKNLKKNEEVPKQNKPSQKK
jgi:hypothetical protein